MWTKLITSRMLYAISSRKTFLKHELINLETTCQINGNYNNQITILKLCSSTSSLSPDVEKKPKFKRRRIVSSSEDEVETKDIANKPK